MSGVGRLPGRVYRSVYEQTRIRFGERTVTREVNGATLRMPWSHRLPDFVATFPHYGRNLIDLAAGLAAVEAADRRTQLLDVGANIGDSALQILARADVDVACVDGDQHWWPYLDMNVGSHARVTVVKALIGSTDDEELSVRPVRVDGTTQFVQSDDVERTLSLSARQLQERLQFENLRLIKSDTDGFDQRIVPGLAAAWSATSPVVFCEFDPHAARRAGDADPHAFWHRMTELGYDTAGVWDNVGAPIGMMSVAEAEHRARTELETLPAQGPYPFWDVALTHEQDRIGLEVVRSLFTQHTSGDLA